MRTRYMCLLLLAVLLSSCQSSMPTVQPAESPLHQPDPARSPLAAPEAASRLPEKDQETLLAAVRQLLSQRLESYAGGIAELHTLEIRQLDERSVVWRGWTTPQSCALVRYEIDLSAVRNGDKWELFDSEDRLISLAVAWATAWSGAHGGEATSVPTSPNKRVVSLAPAAIVDVLQGLLDEPENNLVRAAAGFYLCITDAEGLGSLADEDLAKTHSLIPEVRQLLTANP